MLINKIGFNGYFKPGIKKIKKKNQGIVSDSAVEFEKDNNSKQEEDSSKQKQNDSEKELENEQFQRADNEYINIFV